MNKIKRHNRIKKRVRSNLKGTAERPRISVFRSNKHFYAQAIDDQNALTLVAYSSCTKKAEILGTKSEKSKKIATLFAELLKKKNITKALFDRGWHGYKGRVKAFAEELRANGVEV